MIVWLIDYVLVLLRPGPDAACNTFWPLFGLMNLLNQQLLPRQSHFTTATGLSTECRAPHNVLQNYLGSVIFTNMMQIFTRLGSQYVIDYKLHSLNPSQTGLTTTGFIFLQLDFTLLTQLFQLYTRLISTHLRLPDNCRVELIHCCQAQSFL